MVLTIKQRVKLLRIARSYYWGPIDNWPKDKRRFVYQYIMDRLEHRVHDILDELDQHGRLIHQDMYDFKEITDDALRIYRTAVGDSQAIAALSKELGGTNGNITS